MFIKVLLKKSLGIRGLAVARCILQQGKYYESIIKRTNGLIQSGYKYKVYKKNDKHVFFGYYDLQQLNARQDKLLVHVVNRNANPYTDVAEIFWIDRESGEFHKISESKAWCWQQGSRLRWNPINNNEIIFNTVHDGEYCSEVWNICSNSFVKRIHAPLYDIGHDMTYGVSVNFARLQRLRPGYGYSVLEDKTSADYAPKDDGLFIIDLNNNRKRLLVSLRSLADAIQDGTKYQHYINHVSIAPNDKNIMFFHLWTENQNSAWRTRLYLYNLETNELQMLEKDSVVSHYCWKDNENLLVTMVGGGYVEYNIISGKKTLRSYPELKNDGHPTFLSDRSTILSDTYPLANSMQHLFMIKEDGTCYKEIAAMYSDPRLFLEKRCDLHPRLTLNNNIITVDSTFSNKLKSVVEFYI